MSLYQSSVLKKFHAGQDETLVQEAFEAYSKYFLDTVTQENIRNSKEEQFQEGFLRELFVNILGYTINPNPDYNLTTELRNIKDAKKTDGAILKDGSALAVIELKGTDTKNLEKVTEQAFNYKNNQPDCVYVVTSNFEKLRFYIHNAVEHVKFNLFKLTFDQFKLLWLFLQKDNLLDGIPQKVKEESLLEEEKVTKRLYQDYSAFKSALWHDLCQRNPEADELELYKKSQKLLDRFLFIFFAEDKGLLPPNSISVIVDDWNKLKDLDAYKPLYSRFRKYFGYMNDGFKGKRYKIHAYNGGLFKPDPMLDGLTITDEVLEKHVLKLTEYDFETEVDTNILGHIFEHSLNDIENVRAQLAGEEVDKSKTKRKKDGVFYTPKFITKYIVDNTVGKLCEEKKQELDIDEEEFAKDRKGRRKDTIKKLDAQLKDYREWLLQLTICDPACGSGAFLNQTLEFLMAEHRYVDELKAQLFEGSIVFPYVENHILENNIYGVDINEESVEIARLSLWLRTAKKGRKLTSLSSNIQVGNSLIDDPEVAGELAFNWKEQFPTVFEKGGFDVVIGNPPYVGEKGHSKIFDDLKQVPKWNKFYRRRSNTYYFFIKQGIDLMNEGGLQSLIIPREFISADWSNKVRESILTESKIEGVVDFLETKVFEDAGTTSLILTQRKVSDVPQNYQFDFFSVNKKKLAELDFIINRNARKFDVSELDLSGVKPWNFYQLKLSSEFIRPLGQLFDVSQGLVTGSDKVTNKHVVAGLAQDNQLGRGIFILRENIDIKHTGAETLLNINDNWLSINQDEQKYIKVYLKTEGLLKWVVEESNMYVIYVGSDKLQGRIKEYLLQFATVLLNRSTTIRDDEVITLDEFEDFTLDDIKAKYSSAGAVQKIMRRKRWWLPLYEREAIPFDKPKILVNTKNMDRFTLSLDEHYSSGGGAGGQNYIYPKRESEYFNHLPENISISEYVKFINALLNSSLIQKYIKDGFYNQLSTTKIKDLPIIQISFTNKLHKSLFKSILSNCSEITRIMKELHSLENDVSIFINSKFHFNQGGRIENWLELDSSDFLTELKKKKVKLSLEEEAEWLQYFNKMKAQANAMQTKIDRIDNEIDQKVYELYGLSEEEIGTIEQEK